jgi:nucleoside 2-deoxyribosyltransferase
MKKIYFACSIRGGRDDAEIYAELVEHIKTKAIVLTEIFADGKLTTTGINLPSDEIWKKDTDWIREADSVIAEVTNPSLGVGYEIRLAEELGKPILALYRPSEGKKLSAMIGGAPGVRVAEYNSILDSQDKINEFISGL